MKTFAAIYIGSYEISMKVFELSIKRGIREIDHVRHRIELGRDVYSQGYVGYETADELCQVLKEFVGIMEMYRTDEYEAYSGLVIRDAQNEAFILDQIRIYATSNRRHLIRENFSDKEEVREDMHTSDTVQEKLSLVYRFGVSIYFGAPTKKEFQQIVVELAEKQGVHLPAEELLAEANKWELSHGGLSGRTAQQFINYMLGQEV